MKNLLLSDFLDGEIMPFVYGAFLSRIKTETTGGKKYFYAYTDFHKSKAVDPANFDIYGYAEELCDVFNYFSGGEYWEIYTRTDKSTKIKFYVLDDMGITEQDLFKRLYNKLMGTSWINVNGMTDEKRDFIRGFMELRGPVDTSLNYLAPDYFFNNATEYKKKELLTKYMDVPLYATNYNPRENQPQYVSGEVIRNDQFRLKLDYYAKNIGFINKYKATVFKNSYNHRGHYEQNHITYFTF